MNARARAPLAGLAIILFSLATSAQSPDVPIYDVVIRNGQVLDGAGNPSIRADVAIKGGRFVRIGIVTSRSAREIDAAGRYVSPGWMDMMDQSGATLLENELAENKLREGVTTAFHRTTSSLSVSDTNSPLGTEGLPYALSTFELEGRISSLQGDKLAWTPLATPEQRQMEMPMENVVVRFPEK